VIVIRSLVSGGVAQMDGRLVAGDRLLFVNDVNVGNASLDEAVQALKKTKQGPVLLGVAKPLSLPEMGPMSCTPQYTVCLFSTQYVYLVHGMSI